MQSAFHVYCIITLHYVTYNPQFNLLRLFKPNNYKCCVAGKETSKGPKSGWVCQEMIGKANCHDRAENWLFLGDWSYLVKRGKNKKEDK